MLQRENWGSTFCWKYCLRWSRHMWWRPAKFSIYREFIWWGVVF